MPGRSHEVIALTLYSRPGCHLCDEMKTVINRVAESTPLHLEEIDISSNADLEERYGLEIPVLFVAGKKAGGGKNRRGFWGGGGGKPEGGGGEGGGGEAGREERFFPLPRPPSPPS